METEPEPVCTWFMPDSPDNKGFAEEPAFDMSEDPYECGPAHDAYIRREVRATLDKKKRGAIGFVSLDRAIRKFLPDAR